MKERPAHDYRIELWKYENTNTHRNRRYFDDYETAKTAYMHYVLSQIQCETELARVELQDARTFEGKWHYVPLHVSTQNYINLLTV